MGDRLRELRERAGLSQQELAERTGFGQTEISKLEKGKRRMTLDKAVRLAPALGVNPEELLPKDIFPASRAGVDSIKNSVSTLGLPPKGVAPFDRTLPVRGTAQGGGGRVYMLQDNRPVDWTFRPPPLEGVPDAYGLFVFEDSMAPMFRHGHTLWVHPHLPPAPGDAVVIVMQDEEVIVKELVRRTATAVRVKEYNPEPREFDIPADRVAKMHTVIGSMRR